MLNTVLTVREGQPNSHANKGWEILTDQIIRLLDARPAPLVFLLWGRNAKAKQSLLSSPAHLILATSHPSLILSTMALRAVRIFQRPMPFCRQIMSRR